MSNAEELSRKYGWPLKIHSRGYDAYLVDLQPMNDECPAAIYHFPGGDSVVFDSEIRASKEAEGTDKVMIELFAKKQRGAHYLCPRCGKDAMADDPVRNALSRRARVHVCDACGAGEAMWDFAHTDKEPLAAWAVSMWPGKYGMVESDGEGIAIEGHYGTWYVIDEGDFFLTPDVDGNPETIPAHLFLLEHEEYGDEAACLIVDCSGHIILDDVHNGFDDLEDAGWEVSGQCD